jgi:hypothetical protein
MYSKKMNQIEYPSQNNLYLNLEMDNGQNKVKINDKGDYEMYLNHGYVFTADSQTKYNKRLATAREYNKPKNAGGSRRRPSRKYKKSSKRVFRKKSRSTRRR